MEPYIKEILHKHKQNISQQLLSHFEPAPSSYLAIGILLTQMPDKINFRELLECLVRIAQKNELDLLTRQAALARFFQLVAKAPVSNNNKDRKNLQFLNDVLLKADKVIAELYSAGGGLAEDIKQLFSFAIVFLNSHLNITFLVYTLGKIARSHKNLMEANIAISELSEEDLTIIENQTSGSVPEIFGKLVKASEIAQKHTVNASDSLRVVIFNTLYYLLESRMDDHPALMDHLEANLTKYHEIFTERQKENITREYTRLCDLFEKEKSKSLLELLSPARTNVAPSLPKKKQDVWAPPQEEITGPTADAMKKLKKHVRSGQKVNIRDLTDDLFRVVRSVQEDRMCEELLECMKHDEYNKDNRLAWRLLVKAVNESSLFKNRVNKDTINDAVTEFVKQCDANKGYGKPKVRFDEKKEHYEENQPQIKPQAIEEHPTEKPQGKEKQHQEKPQSKESHHEDKPQGKERQHQEKPHGRERNKPKYHKKEEESKEAVKYVDILSTSQVPDLNSRIQRLNENIQSVLPCLGANEEDHRSGQEFLERIGAVARKALGECKVVIFGSAFAGIWTQGSEIDMTVTTSGTDQDEALQKIIASLDPDLESRKCFSSRVHFIQIIAKAPKLITANLSINNTGGIQTSEFLKKICTIDQRAPSLIKIIKSWASSRKMKDKSKFPSGFIYTLLVIHFLQFQKPPVLPTIAELEQNPGWKSNNELSIGQLLYLFFYHYGVEFIKRGLICDLQDGKLKQDNGNGLFPIKHPITGVVQGNNIKKNSGVGNQIINEMREAYNTLLSSSDLSSLVNS
jgi:predicted nucleotidyltransferase